MKESSHNPLGAPQADVERTGKDLPDFDDQQDHPTSYAAIPDLILDCAKSALEVMPEILQDLEFYRRARHYFLMRNSPRSIRSYYKLDNAVTLIEIGIEAQWWQFAGLQAPGLEDREQVSTRERETTPRDWQYSQGWHQSVGDSSSMRRAAAGGAAKASAEFQTRCPAVPQLCEFLDFRLPFYERPREHSFSPAPDNAATR